MSDTKKKIETFALSREEAIKEHIQAHEKPRGGHASGRVRTLNYKVALFGIFALLVIVSVVVLSLGATSDKEDRLARELDALKEEHVIVDPDAAREESAKMLEEQEREKEKAERAREREQKKAPLDKMRELRPSRPPAASPSPEVPDTPVPYDPSLAREGDAIGDRERARAVSTADPNDPWVKAREKYRATQASRYYAEMDGARRAPMFFGSGAPQGGRRGGAGATDQGGGAGAEERAFLDRVQRAQEHARASHHASAAHAPTANVSPGRSQGALPHAQRGDIGGASAIRESQRGYVDTNPNAASARPRGARGDMVEAGTLVHVVLETGISSALPGQIMGRVVAPVWDGQLRRIIIPAGARVLGEYNARVDRGQERLQVVWTRLILPSGAATPLPRFPGVELSGQSGLSGKVDEHWDRMAAGAAISAGIGAGAGALAGPQSAFVATPRQQAISQGAAPLQRAGEQIATRYLEVDPTIEIPPGARVGMLVSLDLWL